MRMLEEEGCGEGKVNSENGDTDVYSHQLGKIIQFELLKCMSLFTGETRCNLRMLLTQ